MTFIVKDLCNSIKLEKKAKLTKHGRKKKLKKKKLKFFLMEQFVKALRTEYDCFKYLVSKFSSLFTDSEASCRITFRCNNVKN